MGGLKGLADQLIEAKAMLQEHGGGDEYLVYLTASQYEGLGEDLIKRLAGHGIVLKPVMRGAAMGKGVVRGQYAI